MTTSQQLLAECHSLALSLAPELSQHPLYVVDMLELDGLPCTGGCYGWADNKMFMDRAIIDRLGARYVGPGSVVALDLAAIGRNATASQFENCVNQVMVHEAGHILPVVGALEPLDTPMMREFELARMAKTWATPELPAGHDRDPHDWRFVRRVCHLLYRATMAGCTITTRGILEGHSWLCAVEFYVMPLLRECATMANETFAAIEATTPPAAFMELWNSDLARYRHYSGETN